MKKKTEMTTDEWLAALVAAENAQLDPDAVSVREAMERWNESYYLAKSRLDRAVRRGELVKTKKRGRRDGQICIAYKPAPKGKK